MLSNDWLVLLAIAALALVVFVAGLPWLVQPLLRFALWPRYRLQVVGLDQLPKTGPVVLAVNHVTWIDGFVLAAACPRRGRALVNSAYINLPVVRTLARRAGLIPVPFSGPRALRASIAATRLALDAGEVVGLFPEAQLTRNGLLGPFYRGLEVILSGREQVPVIPVALDNLWGSLFSFSGGRFLRKRPQGWRRSVTVVFGPPVPAPVTAYATRQALLATGVRAFERRGTPARPLETIDPSLPRLDHPTLGLLTGSTADFDQGEIHQVGHKPGTVGHPLPGVALRVVADDGTVLGPDAEGRIQALVAGRPDWIDTQLHGSLDRDGFLRVEGPSESRE